jgi:hypothetical protein
MYLLMDLFPTDSNAQLRYDLSRGSLTVSSYGRSLGEGLSMSA